MENNLKYFLVVAEELNISRAAKRLFISQQSLSMHIKKLEEIYQTKLLHRKPSVSLTPAGEMLADTLEQIRFLEDSFMDRITSLTSKARGVLNIGISQSRADIIMPDIITAYKKTYPNIGIVLQFDNTVENLESRLARGYVDFFIGTAQIPNEGIGVIPLRNEKLYIVLSKKFFINNVLPNIETTRVDLKGDIHFSCFSQIPFLLNTEEELSFKIYKCFLEYYDIHLHSTFSCNDSRLRTALCANEVGATIMVESMLHHVHSYNTISGGKKALYYFPIKGLTIPSILAYHKKKFMPEYMRFFIDLVTETTKRTYNHGHYKTGQPSYSITCMPGD